MIEEVHLVHHAHLDVGYTHDQPVTWRLQREFVDRAIDLAKRDLESEDPSAFRWTVESTAPLLRWLESAPPDRVETFRTLEDAGRIEVTGMLANVTPLYGPAQTIESLRPIRRLREEYGLDVRHAMNCDVNGQNWPLVEALLDANVEAFSMAINGYFGGAPVDRPTVFRWEGPSGRTLPTLSGYHYSTGISLGMAGDVERFRTMWPRVEERLDEVGYDLPVLPIQSHHPFADNAPPYDGFTDFVHEWNEQEAVADGDLPLVRMATPATFWEAIEDRLEDLPVHRGDWTDFWNFGSISSARETAVNRESRRRLHAADAIDAVVGAATGAEPVEAETRDRTWWDLHFYDEHTWGADTSTSVPHSEDVYSQWNHKASYAYRARSGSQMLQRDAVAELSRIAGEASGGRPEERGDIGSGGDDATVDGGRDTADEGDVENGGERR